MVQLILRLRGGKPVVYLYDDTTARDAARFQRFLGDTETLNAFNAWQFDDYAKYASSGFDPVKKKAYLETEFPKECERAFQLGKRLAE